MEEMLVTWRTGGPGGAELFGREAQSMIESNVWGDATVRPSSLSRSSSANRRPTLLRVKQNGFHTGASGPSRAQVLTELEVILAQKTRALEINPYDTLASNHLEVLRQVRIYPRRVSLTKALTITSSAS